MKEFLRRLSWKLRFLCRFRHDWVDTYEDILRYGNDHDTIEVTICARCNKRLR